jgi:kynureninase
MFHCSPACLFLSIKSFALFTVYVLKKKFFFLQYLNSGAGCIAGAFIHRKHHQDDRPRLCGWWSNREETRFDMQHSVDAAPGADAYRLCNPPPALVALHKAGLEVN